MVERDEAAARRAVMAGAEGERGLDLDADAIARHGDAIVRAVNDEAAGRDRLQPGEAFADPILGGDGLEVQRLARFRAAGHGGQFAHRGFVGRRGKMDGDAPLALPVIHKADGNLVGGETLGEQVGDPPRRLFIRHQRCKYSIGGGFGRLRIH